MAPASGAPGRKGTASKPSGCRCCSPPPLRPSAPRPGGVSQHSPGSADCSWRHLPGDARKLAMLQRPEAPRGRTWLARRPWQLASGEDFRCSRQPMARGVAGAALRRPRHWRSLHGLGSAQQPQCWRAAGAGAVSAALLGVEGGARLWT